MFSISDFSFSDSNLRNIQEQLQNEVIDGWLFTDHHGRDSISSLVLGEEVGSHVTRRWFYLIPRIGVPRKLLHKIESKKLAHLPGEERVYSRWQEQISGVSWLCGGIESIAVQYSSRGLLLSVSNIDAGVFELLRENGVRLVSSSNLVQRLYGTLNDEQIRLHLEAGRLMDQIRSEAFNFIRAGRAKLRESEVRDFLLRCFRERGLITAHGPVVAIGRNSSDPHYEPQVGADLQFQEGEVILIDMWAKKDVPHAPYYDITWVASLGEPLDSRVRDVFGRVAEARDFAIQLVQERFRKGLDLRGWEVDAVTRTSIEKAGFGEYFTHRTGHSIGTEVHGVGVNMDDFETHDDRQVLNGSCFSIEPGIYLEEFGVRLETNMVIRQREALVSGELQREFIVL